jgi:hypothetical protein
LPWSSTMMLLQPMTKWSSLNAWSPQPEHESLKKPSDWNTMLQQMKAIFHQDCLWYLHKLLHKHIPSPDIGPCPTGKCSSWSNMGTQLLNPTQHPWPSLPSGNLSISMTWCLHQVQQQSLCWWHHPLGNFRHCLPQQSHNSNRSPSPSQGTWSPCCWQCPKPSEDLLLCNQLDLPKEWTTSDETKCWGPWCHNLTNASQWPN